MSSPRRWGCFHHARYDLQLPCVFPTQVGVFLIALVPITYSHRLPHAGGGVSTCAVSCAKKSGSSPRRWGCFPPRHTRDWSSSVFPTQVGVFLDPPDKTGHGQRLPHAGGGVSDQEEQRLAREASSPRRWGCFSNRTRAR